MSNRMADHGKAEIAHLLAAYADGRCDFRSWQLAGADLEGMNLGETDLRGANFAGANLRGASLRSANLAGADLCRADLTAPAWRTRC